MEDYPDAIDKVLNNVVLIPNGDGENNGGNDVDTVYIKPTHGATGDELKELVMLINGVTGDALADVIEIIVNSMECKCD